MIPLSIGKDLYVRGHLDIDDINGINYNRLCDLASPAESSYGLHILGETTFRSEPIVGTINGIAVQELANAAWFTHELANITGNLTLAKVDFRDDIELKVEQILCNCNYIKNYYFRVI